jgi:pyrimidine-nucleoside phosphorylase
MRAVDVIRRKRDGAALRADEIDAFVRGATDGSWADYQLSALLMAVVLRGMTLDEAAALTGAMVRSGLRLDWSDLGAVPVDKHSTGGVGDKISLVLAPLAAAAGAIVPMMSGRGLGHTGGTLDKLEAIPGFRTRLSLDEMRRLLPRVGCVLIGQTDEIAPADRTLYALRDVTATVESVPLICASILSKKIAEGIAALVLDVKVGRGAFMKTPDDASRLAEWLERIAADHGVRAEATLTAMDAPLGRAVGNSTEVIEAIETLKGRGPADVTELSLHLTARLVSLAGIEPDAAAARARVERVLASGAALEKLRAIVEAQGGDVRVIDDYDRLPRARRRTTWRAPRAGVIHAIDAGLVGSAAVALGAGRARADDPVDPAVGIELARAPGQPIAAGDAVLDVLCDDDARVRAAWPLLDAAIVVGDAPFVPGPLILQAR